MAEPQAQFFPSSYMTLLFGNPSTVELNSHLFHEQNHFFQYAGTFMGQALSEFNLARTTLLLNGSKELANIRNELWITLRDWRDDIDDPNIPVEQLDSLTKMITKIIGWGDRYDRIFQSFSTTPPSALPPWSYGFLQGQSALGNYFKTIAPPKHSTSPNINVDGFKFSIGAANLMESFAIYWDLWRKSILESETEKISKPYQPLLLLQSIKAMKKKMGEENYKFYCGPLLYACEALDADVLRIFPFIVDLSLCGPRPDFKDMLKKEYVVVGKENNLVHLDENGKRIDYIYSWETVHPGWRFIAIIDLLKTNPYTIESYKEFGFDTIFWAADVEELYEWVCEKNGWPQIHELTESYIKRLESLGEALHEFYSTSFMHSALKLRLLNISGFAYPTSFRMQLDLWANKSPDSDIGRAASKFLKLPVVLGASFSSVSNNEKHWQTMLDQFISDFFAQHLLPIQTKGVGIPRHYGRMRCPFLIEGLKELCDKQSSRPSCVRGELHTGQCNFNKWLQKNLGIDLSKINFVHSTNS